MKKALLLAAVLATGGVFFTSYLHAGEKAMEEKITALKIIDKKVGSGKEAKTANLCEIGGFG